MTVRFPGRVTQARPVPCPAPTGGPVLLFCQSPGFPSWGGWDWFSVTHRKFQKLSLTWRNPPEQRKGVWLLTAKWSALPGGRCPLDGSTEGSERALVCGDTSFSMKPPGAGRSLGTVVPPGEALLLA